MFVEGFWGEGMKKKNKSAYMIWRGFDGICLCP